MAEAGARGRRINTIRNQLFLSSMLITGVAVALIYLYVVPQLETSLTDQALQRIGERSTGQIEPIERALRQPEDGEGLKAAVDSAAELSHSRVTIATVRHAEGPQPAPATALVVEDSEERESLSTDSAAIASAAVDEGRAEGIGVSTAGRRTELAIALPEGSEDPEWVVIFSAPLREIEETVADIRDQILFAAAIAFIMALIAAYVASERIGRRLQQLAEAAQNAAGGDFATQVPVGTPSELGDVARAFNEMQQRLYDLERARRQFIANASHELRTPIFSLGGFVELLEEEDLDPATRAEFISSMRAQIERLTKLTADLLDLSKLDAGAIHFRPRPIELGRLADEVAREFGPRADAHGSRLEVRTPDRPVTAMADPDRSRQIIRILVDNALKHTPYGTKVTITCAAHEARVTLTVFDEGPGIRKHVQARMFDRFYTAAESGGSGLGLSIARSLAVRMNGQLSAKVRRGSTAFTLDLPRAETAREPTDAVSATPEERTAAP